MRFTTKELSMATGIPQLSILFMRFHDNRWLEIATSILTFNSLYEIQPTTGNIITVTLINTFQFSL